MILVRAPTMLHRGVYLILPARRNDEVEGELMKIVSALGLTLVTYVIVSCKIIFIRL
jgi:hypothetical protein